MCKCWKCGAEQRLSKPGAQRAWRAQFAAAQWTGTSARDLERQPDPDRTSYIPPVVQPGAYIETPIAQQNIESGVKVPLAQSIITGGLIGSMSACVVILIGVPKPLLIVTASTLYSTYRSWKGGINIADSLLTRIEDYTGVDWNRDDVIGSQPRPTTSIRLVKIGSGYAATATDEPAYSAMPDEQYLIIPGMPRSKPDEDPWTIERLTALLEQAFATGRWSKSNRKELGVSQGQWSVLKTYLEGYGVWRATDRPTLQAFIDQLSDPGSQPTVNHPPNR